jgi:hypothetical protein
MRILFLDGLDSSLGVGLGGSSLLRNNPSAPVRIPGSPMSSEYPFSEYFPYINCQ